MSPHEWPVTTDTLAMLNFLFPQRGLDSDLPQPRESRLYLIACGRRAWNRLPGVCRIAVTLAERVYAGRSCDRRLYEQVYGIVEQLVHCRGEAESVNAIADAFVDQGFARPESVRVTADIPPQRWLGYAHLAYYPFYQGGTPNYRLIPPDLHSADLIREVFGNPFCRQPPLPSIWLTPTVIELARQAETDLEILPVLADALQEAGCDRLELLDHLRSRGPHVRGCWALEAVLANRRARP